MTNNPPTQNDEQRTSHNFKQFKKIVDAAKAGKKVKISGIGREDIPRATAGKKKGQAAGAAVSSHKHASNIKQFAEETDEDYLKRVNRITNASVREAQYEAKYGVNVIRNPKTGEITLQKRPKNEIDELLKQKQKERRLAKNGRKKGKAAAAKSTMDIKTSKELIKRAFKEADEEEDEEDQVWFDSSKCFPSPHRHSLSLHRTLHLRSTNATYLNSVKLFMLRPRSKHFRARQTKMRLYPGLAANQICC